MTTKDKLDNEFEAAVGELYRVMFNYRENKLYRAEYDSISTLISMLLEDKLHLYKKHKDEID